MTTRLTSSFARATLVLAATALTLAAGAPAARADGTMVIELDRDVVAPGEPFSCDVTLTVADEQVESYHPPDFKGLRVLSTPQFPNRSTQMSLGGGGTFVQNSYSWHYDLMVPAGAKGPVTIGGAQARVAGRAVKSNTITVRLGATSRARPQAGAPGSLFDLFGGNQRQQQQAAPASSGDTFIRVVTDKTRAILGEPIVAGWFLYTTERLDKFETTTEARTDGFWSEDVPTATPKGRLAYNQETVNGRPYNVAMLAQRALFPLREGKLTITPMEADVAQVGFFGSALRTQHLKADAVTIEALPLPREGQPAGFDVSNVGKYTLAARADRTTVSVGEAVTVTLEVKGVGNVRKVRVPAVPTPEGWKGYPPKESVELDTAAGGVGGTKTVEVLLLPERPGTVMLPAVELATFDFEAKRYVTLKTDPLRLDVTGEAAPAGTARVPGASGANVENVIGAAIRPIRARSSLSRDVGTTLLRSRALPWLLFLPPFALVATALFERVRDRLASDTGRTRRRRMRRLVRRHLDAAVAHKEAGRSTAFFIEIDRVLREVLAARLGQGVTGLRREELGALLGERGMPADATARVLGELEACDQARFAPGGESTGLPAMAAALERADELIGVIEKAPLREEAGA
jgi:hypothetical protein